MAQSATSGRLIGLVPELKSSTYFASAGLPLEDRFIATLAEHEHTRRAPLEVQSFEIASLKYLRSKLGKRTNLRLMQLVSPGDIRPGDVAAAGGALSYAGMVTPAGLREIAAYADLVAPPTRAVIPLGKDERLLAPTALVDDAHRAGLLVHTWTFRPENRFLAADFRHGEGENARNPAASVAEIKRYLRTGIDGLFSDDTALAASHRRLCAHALTACALTFSESHNAPGASLAQSVPVAATGLANAASDAAAASPACAA